MRVSRAVHDHFPLVDYLAVMRQHVFFLGDQELVSDTIHIRDHQALFALGIFAERNRTRTFGQHAGILGHTCFKQLGYAWQTAGNVARLAALLRDARQHIAHSDMLAIFDGDNRAGLQSHADRRIGSGQLDLMTVITNQTYHGAQYSLALRAGALLGVDDNQCG